MKKTKVLLWIITGFILKAIISPMAFAQLSGWENISCTNRLTCIRQSGDFLWMANEAGLVKMSLGTGLVQVFSRTNSVLPYNGISDIEVDFDGSVWVACSRKIVGVDENDGNCALVKIDNDIWTVYDHTNSIINFEIINDVAIDQNNNVWVCTTTKETAGNVVFVLDAEEEEWGVVPIQDYLNAPTTTVNAIAIGADNSKWFSTVQSGLAKFDEDEDLWSIYTTENSDIPHNTVNDLILDSDDVLWLTVNQEDLMPGAAKGLASFDGSNWVIYDNIGSQSGPSSSQVLALYVDNDNNKWISCLKSFSNPVSSTALNCLTAEGTWKRYDETNSRIIGPILSIFQDNESDFWIGQQIKTNDDTCLIRWDKTVWHSIFSNPSKMPNNVINTVQCANGYTLVGTADGLYKFDDESSYIFPSEVFSDLNQTVTALYEDNDSLWIGHEGGITVVSEGTYTYYDYGNSVLPSIVTCITKDQDRSIWIGTAAGLVSIDEDNNWSVFNSQNSDLPSSIIKCLWVNNETVWIGTDAGVAKVSPGGIIDYIEEIGNIKVSDLTTDNDNTLWIGSVFFGLGKFDGSSLEIFNTSNSELSDDRVVGFAWDKDEKLWIATMDGITSIIGDQWENISVYNSGLSSNMCSCIAYNKVADEMVIGSSDESGISIYCMSNPWDFEVTAMSHFITIPVSAQLSINDEPLDNGDWLGLFYLDNNSEVCGGSVKLANDYNGSLIVAYGDNLATPNKEGFSFEEQFSWKIYDASQGAVYVAEATYDQNMNDLGVFCNNGQSKVLSIKAPTAQIAVQANRIGDVFAYPNPVSGTLYVDMKENVDVLELLDAQGKTIRKYNAEGKSSLIVNVTDVQPGVYLLRFECAKKTVSCKTIIIK